MCKKHLDLQNKSHQINSRNLISSLGAPKGKFEGAKKKETTSEIVRDLVKMQKKSACDIMGGVVEPHLMLGDPQNDLFSCIYIQSDDCIGEDPHGAQFISH
jgi:hypothetical protein